MKTTKKVAFFTATLVALSCCAPLMAKADSSASPLDKAISAADQAVKTKLQSNDGTSLQRVKAQRGDAQTELFYVTYKQSYQGHRVVGGDAIVATKDGSVTDVSKQKISGLPAKVESKISADQAKAKAAALFTKVETATTPELVVFADDSAPKNAYYIQIFGTKSLDGAQVISDQKIYIDASTGDVIRAIEGISDVSANGYFNGKVDIDVSGGRMVSNTARGVSCSKYGSSTALTYSGTPGNGGAVDLVTACVDVVYATESEHKMMKDWLGRDGMDGSGKWAPSRVGWDQANAHYIPSQSLVEFGTSKGGKKSLTEMDVVAHEYGHGVFDHINTTSNGGLNESFADIFGALTEFYANNPKDKPDYTVGEEVDLSGNGPIRYMYEPSKIKGDGSARYPQHPDCFSPNMVSEVHAAAGPMNHFFFLLAEGSTGAGGQPKSPTCNKSTIDRGVGIKDAGRIVYNAISRTNSSRYEAVRTPLLNSAKDLDPTCGFFTKTKAALDATSFPAAADEPTCKSSSTPTNPTTKPNPTKPGVDKDELSSGQSVSFDLGAGKSVKKFVSIPANARSLVVKLSADNGDADLYVSQGSEATEDHYDCRPWLSDSNETCSIDRPKQGKTFIMVSAAEGVSNLTLVATWK